MLALETLVVPYVTPRVGVKRSQRIGSMIEVPIYILLPMLSRAANSDGIPIFVASVTLLVICYAGSNAVGDFNGPRGHYNLGIALTLQLRLCQSAYLNISISLYLWHEMGSDATGEFMRSSWA